MKLKSLRWWGPVPKYMQPDRLKLCFRERFIYWLGRRVLRLPYHSFNVLWMLADMELTADALYRAKEPIDAAMPDMRTLDFDDGYQARKRRE